MKKTVLIVDDSFINRQILINMLGMDYNISEAENGKEALSIMHKETHTISVVLLDLMMPVMDGFAVLEAMRDNPVLSQIPVIITTGSTDLSAEKRALSLGANDYVTKPYDLEILKRRLDNLIKLKETSAMINMLQKDYLTKIWNRETFFKKARWEINRKPEGYFVLSCIDIDNFKVVNDQYGTEKGDEVLKELAQAIKKLSDKNGSICGRISEDTFAVLFTSQLIEEYDEVGEKHTEALTDALSLPLTISVGRYIIFDKSLPVSAMFDRALLAMKTVKGRYDKHIATYEETMRNSLVREQEIISEMKSALESNQFEAWLQPQYNHATGARVGAEALARWRHPVKGMISPMEFIPVFEHNGFVYELDKYIWEQVCGLLRKWLDENRNPLPISVNISRYDLFREDLVPVILGLTEKYRIPTELLRLEITESAFASSTSHIVSIVKEFIKHGFTVEIDDFGSGYSSLNTLKDVPAQILKLDMRFLDTPTNTNPTGDENDSISRGGNILESVVRMAKWLGMSVIAEGVETLAQANYLKSIGCVYIQGYLYARPMHPSDYEKLSLTTQKEEHLITLETVNNLDNISFWDPNSLDTLIFNSYVGAAGIFEYHNGKIELLRVTEKFAESLGGEENSIERMLSLDWNKHIDEENSEKIQLAISDSIATKKETYLELRFKDLPTAPKDIYLGTLLRVIATAGDRCLVYMIVENLTAQRLAERKEKEISTTLNSIMNNIDSGIVALNFTSEGKPNFIFANERYYSMLGYTKEQFLLESPEIMGLVYPDDREYSLNQAFIALENNKNLSFEYRCITRAGEIIYCHCNSSVTHLDGVGKVLLSALTDVTKEKKIEQEILAADEKLMFLNDISRDLLAQSDVNVSMNKVLQKILNYFRADRTYIVEISEQSGLFKDAYEAHVDGIFSLLEKLKTIPVAHYISWLEKFASSGIIYIPDSAALPDDRKGERELLKSDKVKTLVAVPFYRDKKLLGFIGIDNPLDSRIERAEQLLAMGDYIAVILTRRDLMNKIENDSKSIRRLMNDTPGGFARLRVLPNGRIATEYVNAPFCQMRGMTFDQIIEADKDDAMNTIHPDDIPKVSRALQELLTTQGMASLQYRLLHSDGNYYPYNITGRLSKDEAGQSFVNLYYTSMTEQEKKDLELVETMPFLLSAIMQSSPNLDFAKDKNFRYICCSQAFARFTGQKTPEDVIGKTDYDFFSKEAADRFREDDEKLFREGQSLIDYTEAIPSTDSVPHYSLTSKYILRDSTGSIIGLYGTGRDITDTRAAFQQLKLLTDSIPGGIATYAAENGVLRLTYFNDGFCKILGCTREEYEKLAKENVFCGVYPEDMNLLLAQAKDLLENGISVNCVYRITKKNCEGYRWANLRAVVSEKVGDIVFANAVLYDITEQKLSEEALRIHEKELDSALSKMGRIIAEYDINTKTLVLPEAYATKYGLNRIIPNVPYCFENIGRMTDEMFAEYRKLYEAILRGEDSGSAEIMKLNPSGEAHWERMTFVTIFNESGKPIKALIASDDTTKQHQQFEIENNRPFLKEKNLIARALFNLNTGETLDYTYGDGSVVPLKERTAFLFGGDNLSGYIVGNEDREKYRDLNNASSLLARYESGERNLSMDYRRHLPSGEMIWVRNILRMVPNPAGEGVLLFEYCYDIEDEKTQELMLDSIIDMGYDFMARIDGRTKEYFAILGSGDSYSLPEETGSDSDQMISELMKKTAHPDDIVAATDNLLLENIKKHLKNQNRFLYTFRELQPDGTIRYKKITAYYVEQERDIIIITREDVTQIMQKEEQKNLTLSEALNAAKQANYAKSTFLSRMSHELRSPMNAIIGLTALSATELSDEKAMKNNIEKIGMSARYLLSLINDILEMSRIESGKMTLSAAPFDFERFITEINSIIYSQAAGKGLEYEVIVKNFTEPNYVGDATKLQEILINILGNSVKFTPTGGKITLSIEQLRCVKSQATLRFIITDTGIGIDENFLPHIFEAFAQESTSYISTSAGTGLGLAITKNLVEMMNGQIQVKSIKNVGSVFTIDVVLGISENSQQYMDMIAAIKLDKLYALVVDDDVLVCKNTEQILKTMGMRVDWVDSGIQAIEKVKEAKKAKKDYNTIFLDWKMPDMDGIETTRRIRKIVGPEVTIVIMTAFDWRSIEEEARDAGVDLFMDKPLFQSSIVKAFEKIFMRNSEIIEPIKPTVYDFSGKHILLAEDNVINIEVARRLLEKVNAEVTVVNNGIEAIETFATAKDGFFDLILMDIRMPEMDGLTATKSIRKLKKFGSKSIPIIAMTANAFDEDVELSLRSGMNAHLTKPIEPQLMYSVINRYLNNN